MKASNKELPVILQTETVECGLACMAMILGFYGFNIDLYSLRSRFAVSAHGLSLDNLITIASTYNLSARPLRIELEKLDYVQLPCILHWNLNHFVVLKRYDRKKIVIHDPSTGERCLTRSEFSDAFTGVALELMPTANFTYGEQVKKLKLADFWPPSAEVKSSLSKIVVLSIILLVFSIISPLYMKVVLDDVAYRGDKDLMFALALGFGLVLLLQLATSALRESLVTYATNKFGFQLSASIFRHLIRLPAEYFMKRHLGDVLSRFDSVRSVRDFLTTGIVTALVDGVMCIVVLAAMWYLNSTLCTITICFVVIYIIARIYLYRSFLNLSETSLLLSSREKSYFIEGLRAIQFIRLFGKEDERQSKWENLLASSVNSNILISNHSAQMGTISLLLFGLENILFVYVSGMLLFENTMTIGVIYAFLSYKTRFISSTENIVRRWAEFQVLDVHFARMADIVFTEKDKLFTQSNMHDMDISGELEVKGLSYRFSELEEYTFKDVSFKVGKGQSLAIVGRSGCGKTTLLKCLLNLYSVSTGTITVDGKSVAQIANYRHQVATVMQEDVLLTGDILQNIASFDHKIDLEKVKWAARHACLDKEIELLPMKYHTLVGDMGIGLSVGQKQRVLLARALYKKPKILFLDEATSNLDVENEKAIVSNLKLLGMTCIFVAHRPEMIGYADLLVELH